MTKKIKIMAAGLIVFFAFASLAAWLLFGKSDFEIDKVKVILISPETAVAGDDFVVRILYENNNEIPLKNAVLVFDKPNEFVFGKGGVGEYVKSKETNIGAINSGGVGELKLKGNLIAPMNTAVNFKFHLKFIPGNVNASLEKIAETDIKISTVPITISLNFSPAPINGYPAEYKVSFANETAVDFQKVAIFADYPSSFTFITADPSPILGNNKIWNVETLKGKERRDLVVKGVISGDKDEVINVKFSIGIMSEKGFTKYAEATGTSKLILPPINLVQTVNGGAFYNANPGEELDIVIKYKNNSADKFESLRIVSNLTGEVLDFGSLIVENGIYDEIPDIASAKEAVIGWNDRSLPALSALGTAEEREVRFKIKVKDRPPVKNTVSSMNFFIKNFVKVYAKVVGKSEENLITDNEFTTKLSSKLILNAKAYYNDDGRIMNSGPIPPRVEKQTNFTVHWQVLNMANDARDVIVRAVLPQGAIWTEKTIPKDAPVKIDFNGSRTEVTWRVGDLPANAGVFSPVREIIFQLGVIPEAKDVGDYKTIVGKMEITGMDNFTGVPLKTTRDEITTRLFDDISIGPEEGKVVP